MALKIINNFELTNEDVGTTLTGKQGLAVDGFSTPFEFTVTRDAEGDGPTIAGTAHFMPGSLATATVVTLWDDDNDSPVGYDYVWFWADQDCYIQVIGATSHVVLPIQAYVPQVFSSNQLIAAASTTAITGGTEPTLEDVDSIVIGNYSGATMKYLFVAID